MRSKAQATAQRRMLILAIGTGTITTALGLTLLITAGRLGSSLADFSLELGVAVGLSGILWKCASLIQQEQPEGRTDWSALLILLSLGVIGVIYAVIKLTEPDDILLTTGAAFVTVWLFCLLEEQFVLDKEYELPLWAKIVSAPIYPFVWLMLRGLTVNFGPEPVELDVENLLLDRQLAAELSTWDSDSPYRGDPEYMREMFETTAEDLSRNMGITFPEELVEWVDAQNGKTVATQDGSMFMTWRWAAIRLHPVSLEYDVLVFGEEHVHEGDRGSLTYILAVDLRSGPLFGCVVRGVLLPGSPPIWRVQQPLEIVGATFRQWRDAKIGIPSL